MAPEQPVPEQPQPPVVVSDSIGKGVGHALLCAVLMFIPCALTVIAMFAFGLLEWAGLLPLYFWEKRKGRPLAAKGVLLTGLVIFLVQAACYGIVLSQGLNIK